MKVKKERKKDIEEELENKNEERNISSIIVDTDDIDINPINIKSNEKNEEIQQLEIEDEEPENKSIVNKSKRGLIITLSIIALCIIGIFLIIFSVLNFKNDNILKGVYIEGINISDISAEEAKNALNEIIDEKLKTEITLKHEGYETAVSPETLEIKYNVDKAIEEAFNYGRDSNIFTNNFRIMMLKFKNVNIDIEYTINEEEFQNIIGKIENEVDGAVVPYSYYVEKDTNKLIITRGKEGIGVEENIFKGLLNNILGDFVENTNYIEIPTVTKQPGQVDVDKIYEEVHKEVQNASYTKEPFSIIPEVDGVDFDKEAVKKLINAEYKDEYEIDLTITKAEYTVYKIGAEAFPNVIATFSTNYDSSNTGRTTNLRLAAQKVNGTILMPGEEFSYNKIVGERTIAAGYKDAKIYSNGEVVDGLGGGICQISSTLYNTALMANLKITQRRNHQFVTSYVPAGRDATVVWGSQDFKFVNTRNYPIRINTSVSGGVATVTFNGLKEDVEYEISFQSATVSTIPSSTKYQEDSTLPVGTEKVKQQGANGKIVETYKIMKLNGQVVSKTLISRDTYNAMQKIILRGTKQTQTTATPTNNTTSTEATNTITANNM